MLLMLMPEPPFVSIFYALYAAYFHDVMPPFSSR